MKDVGIPEEKPAWLDCGEEGTRIKEMRRKRDGEDSGKVLYSTIRC